MDDRDKALLDYMSGWVQTKLQQPTNADADTLGWVWAYDAHNDNAKIAPWQTVADFPERWTQWCRTPGMPRTNRRREE